MRSTRSALAVLRLCDGVRSVADIVGELAAAYAAPAELIARDVVEAAAGPRRQAAAARRPRRLCARRRFPRARDVLRAFPGGPPGLLAELTHRCPLQCPYCSNPLEMERANGELSADEWGERFSPGRGDGRAAIASLRRRADGAARPRPRSSPMRSTPGSTRTSSPPACC